MSKCSRPWSRQQRRAIRRRTQAGQQLALVRWACELLYRRVMQFNRAVLEWPEGVNQTAVAPRFVSRPR